MDMGTGKTITTIALAGALYQKGNIKRLLIIAPKSIVSVWKQELEKFADFQYTAEILEGTATKKQETLREMQGEGLQILIVNYESVWRLEEEISDWRPDMIVCDESSKIKNPKAKCSKCLHKLGKKSKYNLILTGTPITNSPLDFYSQYKFLDESIYGGSYYAFQAKYAIMGGYQQRQITGYRNIEELVAKAHRIAYRVKLSDAVELPSTIDKEIMVDLEPKARLLYNQLEKDSYAELMQGDIKITNILTKLLRLSQLAGGYMRYEDGSVENVSQAKMDALTDIVDRCIDEGNKVVVFARFIPEIEAIERMLKKKGIGYALIKGDVEQGDRATAVEQFQTNEDCKVFVGQLQTTSMGLTLTAAHVCVFYSLDFSYANYEQSRARIHRIGQKDKCIYIHLIAKGTVDELAVTALKQKGDVAKLVVDDYRKILNGGYKNGAKNV